MAGDKKVIIIAGPTAAGKTALAIKVAQHLGTEIISADSRQCFKELNIGVARPSPEELTAVKHYFIASHSIHQKVNAVTFEQYALEKVDQLFRQSDTVVLVGGTGLYIKAFCEGMDEIPGVPESIHNEIIYEYQKNGLEWLQGQVRQVDPIFFATAEHQNPQRLMRALEVFKSTGHSILTFRRGKKATRDFGVIKLAVELPKEQLHHHINTRVDKMMAQGLMEEVRSLVPYQHLNALQTVGYKELFDVFNGASTLSDAIHLIKQNTRQYAKRQLTWFRKDKEYQWLNSGTDVVLEYLDKVI